MEVNWEEKKERVELMSLKGTFTWKPSTRRLEDKIFIKTFYKMTYLRPRSNTDPMKKKNEIRVEFSWLKDEEELTEGRDSKLDSWGRNRVKVETGCLPCDGVDALSSLIYSEVELIDRVERGDTFPFRFLRTSLWMWSLCFPT